MIRAITREVPASFVRALAMSPQAIDVELACAQHAAYRAALAACGAEVTVVAADEACPDCCFVEDTAVIAGDRALITRPGAPSRRAETRAIADALRAHVELVTMEEPATLDGGDCMRVGDTIYVGRSARTNAAGIARLAEVFGPAGSRAPVVAIDLPPGVLHLKCVCSPLDDERILLADDSLAPSLFDAQVVRIPAEETYAANAVAIGKHVIVADGFPRTHEALDRAGFTLHPVPTSEVRKADGSLTCQSLIVARSRRDRAG
jgi:dimethylargininase